MASKDTGTSVDLAPTSTVDDATAAAFELDPHLISLMWSEPFFSRILRTVTKVKTDAIPTAGVLAKDGDIKMWWNPKFVAGLTSKQVKGLMKHECFHLIFEHTTTRRHDPHIIWNYATDLAINSLIPTEELPEGGLVPGKAFKELTAEDKAKMGDVRVGRYERVSAKIASLPLEMSAEWYFAELQEVADDIEGEKGEGGGGCGGQCDGTCQPGDGEGQAGDGQCTCPGMPGPMDDHEGWDELSDEERELVKGKVKQALEEAVREADRTGQWGTMGAGCRGKIRELVSKEIPWQSILKQFCGMTRRANRDSNVKRLNRKYTGIHPGTQRGYTSSIAVYIDQSGSVGDSDLALFFGELKQLARRTEFTIYNFDTEVDEDSKRIWKRNRTPGLERTRCGGTCFKSVKTHAEKNRKHFDGYLVLTDGEASDPGPSKLKRGWVLCPGTNLLFDAARRDFVIKMKGKAAA
jgi:predicted metal-dependent peptidase